MLPTDSTLQSETPSPAPTDRERLLDLLNRERIQNKLYQHGISLKEAEARINSLTDEEIEEIGNKARLAAGGHGYGDDDPVKDLILEIMFWVTLFGLIALVYLIGVLIKSVACPFQERCNVFLPWWSSDDGSEYEYTAPVLNPPEPPSEPPPPIGSGGSNGVYIPGGECDSREQACEWSVR